MKRMLNGYEVEDEEPESRFEAEYNITKLLYNGTFSAVYECVHRPSREKFAVKIVDVPRFLTVHSKEQLANETKIAELLLNHTDPSKPCRHPHLVTPLDCRSEHAKYYMIYERLHHRDICFEIEHRVAQFVYGEHIARHYMRQILEAVRYMHLKSVVHRDLKVSCILLAKCDQIKIGGFRAAVRLPERGYMQDSYAQSGTVHYMAPEVIRCELYGRPVDIWGCGVVLYILLTGTLPFTGKTADVFKRVLSNPDFSAEKWSEVSVSAKQLCMKMLTSDQHQRISVHDALQHPWIKSTSVCGGGGGGGGGSGVSKSPLRRAMSQMSRFNGRRKIQSAINIAANSSLWDQMAATLNEKQLKHTSLHAPPPPLLDALHTNTMNKAVNDVITMIQDSVEEAHILHEVPQYVFNTSVQHDPKLTTLLRTQINNCCTCSSPQQTNGEGEGEEEEEEGDEGEESSVSLSPVLLVSSPTSDSNTNHSPEKRSELTIKAEMQSSKAKLIFSNAQLHKISKPAPAQPRAAEKEYKESTTDKESSYPSNERPKRKSNSYASNFAHIGIDAGFCDSCEKCHKWKSQLESSSCGGCSNSGSLRRCTSGQQLYDRIAVDLCSAFSRESISFVNAGDAASSTGTGTGSGVFNLATEVSCTLQHQLDTNQSFTPHDSSHMRDILQNTHFTALLRAHDVIVSEFFGSEDCSIRCSPLAAPPHPHNSTAAGVNSGSSSSSHPLCPRSPPMSLSFSSCPGPGPGARSRGGCSATTTSTNATLDSSNCSSKQWPNTDNHHHQHQQSCGGRDRDGVEHHRSNSDTHVTSNGDCVNNNNSSGGGGGTLSRVTGSGTADQHHCATVTATAAADPNSNLTSPLSSPGLQPKSPPNITRVKLVNFHRNPGEPLGIILKILKTDQVVVSRIMIGGMIHRQKILSEGDEIVEINGQSIRKQFSEDALRSLLNDISGDIVIKVKSNNHGANYTNQHEHDNTTINSPDHSFFVRAMFDYRPEEDTTCQAAAAFGLAFHARDILQILKQKPPPHPHLEKLTSSRQSLSSSSVAPDDLLQSTAAALHASSLANITESQRWWQAQVVCRASETAQLEYCKVAAAGQYKDEELGRVFVSNPLSVSVASKQRKVGLVPSCLWRMEMIKNNEKMSAGKIRSSCGGLFKKKKKVNMISLSEDEIYERVVLMADPLPRKSLLLVGAPGVGRRSIKNALIQMDQRFAYPKPHTNKPPPPAVHASGEEGDEDSCEGEGSGSGGRVLYHHVPHQELVGAANRGEYLELGKYHEFYFGTKYDTIDRIIGSNLIPVLDIEPDSIKKLRNAKYMPYVVFVDAPKCFENAPTDDASIVQSFEQLLSVSGDIDRHYRALFDMTVINSSMEHTVHAIRAAFDLASSATNHWVPLNWIQSPDQCCGGGTLAVAATSRNSSSSLQTPHSTTVLSPLSNS